MSRNLVITGAAGALGTAVVGKFKREGYYVIALVRPEANEQSPEADVTYEVDVTDEKAVQDMSVYDWFIENLKDQKEKNLPLFPKQREFARLNLAYTIMSKRILAELVQNKIVSGWDDPRMPTISGLRRRGYTPEAINTFIKKVGVSKRENLIDVSLLEFCARDDLNKIANRKMVVINPLKLTITNYPEDKIEQIKSENNPELESAGLREIPFSKHLYIEKEEIN